jgi:hypothetical protein
MTKIWYFVTITVGLTLLMKLAGIPFTGSDALLTLFGLDSNNLSVSTSFFVITMGIALGVAATLGSIFSKESSVRAGFIIAIGVMGIGVGTFIGILKAVYNVTNGTSQVWVYNLLFLVFAVYIVGYFLALFDYWGGTG